MRIWGKLVVNLSEVSRCYSDNRDLLTVMEAGGLSPYNLIQPTISLEMSVPLRFTQFSGCWLILSVCWLVSFAFPFGRLLGVRYFCYYPYSGGLIILKTINIVYKYDLYFNIIQPQLINHLCLYFYDVYAVLLYHKRSDLV